MPENLNWLPDWFWDDTEAEQEAKKYILDTLVAYISQTKSWPDTHPNWVTTPAYKPGDAILDKPVRLTKPPTDLVPVKFMWQGTVTNVEIHPDTYALILAQPTQKPCDP